MEETTQGLSRDGHIVKLGKCTEDWFILLTVLTAKRFGSVKLALKSKLIIKQIYCNRYQMPNMNELVDNLALAFSGKTNDPMWFLNKDLR